MKESVPVVLGYQTSYRKVFSFFVTKEEQNVSKTIVYTKYGCPQCDMTKTLLAGEGIDFEIRNVMDDEKALAFLKDSGYSSTPVTFKDGFDPIVGFAPDKLKGLAD